MKTKIQIKSILGNLLFEYESENNSILNTLKEALKTNANLRGANLRGANLIGADLSGANLIYADIRDANLSCANLRGANLRGVDLSSADLSGANLIYANLRDANLSCANLSYVNLSSANLIGADLSNSKNKEFAFIPQFCKWSHCIIGNKIKIGCKEKTIEEWQLFFDSNEEYSTKRNTEHFKQIQAIFESYKAYINFLNK